MLVQGIDLNKLINGDRRTLAKAITLIESTNPDDFSRAQNILEQVMPHTGQSIRIGITGVPGVGKSTFIENFGLFLSSKGFKIAVLAIDPSSPISGGSIMGDKTRMEKLSQLATTFIRPSPSSGVLGGVAQKTFENILLCEAAGFNYIFIETVGVGQSEYDAANLVDFFIFLTLPNAGDELQGIKKGILELVDAVIINKCDGLNLAQANLTFTHFEQSLALIRSKTSTGTRTGNLDNSIDSTMSRDRNLAVNSTADLHFTDFEWKIPIIKSSALENNNFDLIFEMIQKYKVFAVTTTNDGKNISVCNGIENIDKINNLTSNPFKQKRNIQLQFWFERLITDLFLRRLKDNKLNLERKEKLKDDIIHGRKSIFEASKIFVDEILL